MSSFGVGVWFSVRETTGTSVKTAFARGFAISVRICCERYLGTDIVARAASSSSFHGDLKSFNQHWHVLMAIDGSRPDWDDFRVEMKTLDIDREFIRPAKSEKLVHVDREWREGNRYHSYVSRY